MQPQFVKVVDLFLSIVDLYLILYDNRFTLDVNIMPQEKNYFNLGNLSSKTESPLNESRACQKAVP